MSDAEVAERHWTKDLDGEPVALRPAEPAALIRTESEAIEAAHQIADLARAGASQRDREGRLPLDEVHALSQSGLLGISIPKEYGGAGLSYAVVGRVFEIIAAADPSLAQIPQSHFVMAHLIGIAGSEDQKRFLFGEILKGLRLGNAAAEFSKDPVSVMKTRLTPAADGYRLNGQKFYATGALTAHIVTVTALNDEGKPTISFVERTTSGLRVVNDWAAFGQRTTASGTVLLEDVQVSAERVIPAYEAFTQSPLGAIAQLLHSGIDIGIASEALKDTIHLVRTYARPWRDANQQHGYEDLYSIAQIGELEIRLHAAQMMLARAGVAIDEALTHPDEDSLAAASVAAAESKFLAADIAIQTSNRLFELVGTRATLVEHNLDRHWRNARTHTLHDPVRWKLNVVGNYYLNGIKPPRHPLV